MHTLSQLSQECPKDFPPSQFPPVPLLSLPLVFSAISFGTQLTRTWGVRRHQAQLPAPPAGQRFGTWVCFPRHSFSSSETCIETLRQWAWSEWKKHGVWLRLVGLFFRRFPEIYFFFWNYTFPLKFTNVHSSLLQQDVFTVFSTLFI